MLVLTRRENEEIVIGNNIRITIVEIQRGGKVRLGITAPKDVPVHREEVYEAMQQEKAKKNTAEDAR